ncbi:39S ribosomal protein L47, mitochondrial [Corythoichthys intestinalis]|uniref:39S ribosomal protein L47, mitochondrial n=1 Tax=Corythoichthys intestinalis TaxID=161448 RepID=UPI0025A600E9|nr:39S ribosomal protein L47, mitochondrial [Corythoichthys intestinalis]XP_061791241.1 large ribosomal subunit protein uL29m-like [Nerophis lumbriciformis]
MAASSSAGLILSLCKKLQNICRISSQLNIQRCATSVTHTSPYLWRKNSLLVTQCEYSRNISLVQWSALHTSVHKRGLDEFFDFPENWGESTVKSGAPWTGKQLRTKSNEDLHKLWYVLLKERNMLLTLEQEAKRQRVQMPSPERLRKVQRSMTRLDTIVAERENSLRLLQTGQEKGRPGAWRRNVFGYAYWYRFKEYAIPWYMNKHYKRKKFYTPAFVEPHIRLRIEKFIRAKYRKANMERKKLAVLKEKFPQMKVPAT